MDSVQIAPTFCDLSVPTARPASVVIRRCDAYISDPLVVVTHIFASYTVRCTPAPPGDLLYLWVKMIVKHLDDSFMDRLCSGPGLPESLPLASAAARAAYDVERGTQALYELHLEVVRDLEKYKGRPPHPLDSNSRFTDAALEWWRLTGGWAAVDKDRSIRAKYPPFFIGSVNNYNDALPAMRQLIDLHKKAKAAQPAVASSSKPAPSKPKANQGSFDVVGATRALFRVAESTIRPANYPAQVYEDMFDRLAHIWCERIGGPDHVDKSILARYPSWFVGKIEMFKRQQDSNFAACGSRVVPKPEFVTEKDTRELFELGKRAYPNAAPGKLGKCSSFNLEVQFAAASFRWCQYTGGWDKVDKAIRDQHPKWFVDHLAVTNKNLPVAKIMALEGWNKRTGVS